MGYATILPGSAPFLPGTRELRVDPRSQPRLWYPGQQHTWENASFTVPLAVSEERVQFCGAKYRLKFGNILEAQGFEVLGMEGPTEDRSVLAFGTTDPDRRRYIIWAKIRRRPVEFTIDVPDEDVLLYQQCGFTLKE